MRCLNRNKQTFYYAPFLSITPVEDEYGNETGESKVLYGQPVRCEGNISAARGETVTRQFGEDVGYDRVIVMDDPDIPIDEYSVLWVDNSPMLKDMGDGHMKQDPWDYTVRKVARSLNSVSIAISKVPGR